MASIGSSVPPAVVLKKLDDHLTCSICLDRFTDPRTLPCQHACCKLCIDQLLEKGGTKVVKCPTCRNPTKLDEEGASTLPKAFHINNILEIDELLKRTPANESTYPECSKHKKVKNLFCEKCEEHVCFKCSREFHSDHLKDIDEADDLFDKHIQHIRRCLQPVDRNIATVKFLLDSFDTREKEIQDQGEAAKKEINQIIQQHLESLQELLQASKKVLFHDAETATCQKLELLSLERAEFETVLVQLKSCKEFVEEKLGSQSQYQIQAAKKEIVQCISDAHSKVKVSDLQPKQKADLTVVKDNSAIEAYGQHSVGRVKSSLNYQPFLGMFSVQIPKCVLTKKSTDVSLFSSMPVSVECLYCDLEPCEWFSFERRKGFPVIKVNDEGHFKVILNPDQPGLYELSVCIDGTHVTGSPFEVPVMSIAEWRGQRLKIFARGLKHPRGLAVTNDGKHVIVTEWHGHRVAVFSAATGELLYRFGKHGTYEGDFNQPVEVVVSNHDHIIVKDSDSIQEFTLNGVYLKLAHQSKIDRLQFGNGLAVLPCGSVLTGVDGGSIYKISPDFSELALFSDTFDGEPYDITVDTRGIVYVLTSHYGIHILTPDGRYINSICKNTFDSPFEFCISCNVLYVTNGSVVSMYTTEGECIGNFGNYSKLRGIAVCKTTGDLYISKASGEVLASCNEQEKEL